MGKEINHCGIPVNFADCDFTKFWVPPPFSLNLKQWHEFSPSQGIEDNPIHLVFFLYKFPWLARGPTPGGSRWHVHCGRWLLSWFKPHGVFCKVRFLAHLLLGRLHMSPVNLAGLATGNNNFTLGSYEKFQPSFWDEIRLKILRISCGAKFEKQSKHGETQSYNFCAYHSFGNFYRALYHCSY